MTVKQFERLHALRVAVQTDLVQRWPQLRWRGRSGHSVRGEDVEHHDGVCARADEVPWVTEIVVYPRGGRPAWDAIGNAASPKATVRAVRTAVRRAMAAAIAYSDRIAAAAGDLRCESTP